MSTRSKRVGRWLCALVLSLLIHGLVAEYLRWGTEPDPIIRQDARRTLREISSIEVPTDRARAHDVDSDQTPSQEAHGERLSLQAITSGRMQPLPSRSTLVAVVTAEGQRLVAQKPRDGKVLAADPRRKDAAHPALRPSSLRVNAETPELASVTPLTAAALSQRSRLSRLPEDAVAVSIPAGEAARVSQADAVALNPLAAAGTKLQSAPTAAVGQGAAVVAVLLPSTVTRAVAPDVSMAPEADAAALAQRQMSGAIESRWVGETTLNLAEKIAPSRDPTTALLPTVLPHKQVRLAVASAIATGSVTVARLALSITDTAPNAASVRAELTVSMAERLPSHVISAAKVAQSEMLLPAEALRPSEGGAKRLQPRQAAVRPVAAVATQPSQVANLGAARFAAPATSIEPQFRVARQSPAVGAVLPSAVPIGIAASAVALGAVVSSARLLDKQAVSVPIAVRLAWSGTVNAGLDQESLATIQSLMRSSTVDQSQAYGGSAKDQIAASLAHFGCSRLQAVFQPETGGLEIRGHVPEPAHKSKIVAMLQSTVGSSIPIGGSLLVLPRPQCSVLEAVERLGVKQSTEQEDGPLVMGQEAQAQILSFEEDDRMSFVLKAPAFDGYIYFDYFDSDGNVVHILPSASFLNNFRKSNTTFELGADQSDNAAFSLRAAPPFGQDIGLVIATSRSLHSKMRPAIEKAAVYLEWLAERLNERRAADSGFQSEWAYLFVRTGAHGSFLSR